MTKVKDLANDSTLIVINGIASSDDRSIEIEIHKDTILKDEMAIKILRKAIGKLEKHEYETHI